MRRIRAFEAAGRQLVPIATLEANALACDFDGPQGQPTPSTSWPPSPSRNWLGRIAARKAIAAAQGIAERRAQPATSCPSSRTRSTASRPQCDESLAPDQYLSNQLTARTSTHLRHAPTQ